MIICLQYLRVLFRQSETQHGPQRRWSKLNDSSVVCGIPCRAEKKRCHGVTISAARKLFTRVKGRHLFFFAFKSLNTQRRNYLLAAATMSLGADRVTADYADRRAIQACLPMRRLVHLTVTERHLSRNTPSTTFKDTSAR